MASDTYQIISSATEAYLRAQGSFDRKTAKSNRAILDEIRRQIQSGQIVTAATDATILQYVSFAANKDESSSIVSAGGRGGYWISAVQHSLDELKPEDEEKITPTVGPVFTLLERDLYPLVELWLEQKGYRSKDISSLKKGGKWGNPDIIGIDRVELFGAVELELASCEVKLSEKNWEQFIFEAISHKRFANRSWFCYRVAEDGVPLPKGIEYYAERYRVGVVQIILSDDELDALKRGNKPPVDFIDQVDERVPALYDIVPLKEKGELIRRADMKISIAF